MPRGKAVEDGTTRVSPNGYHYTKVDGKWRLTHHIVAEKHILKRPLRADERVTFIGCKTDLSPSNIRVVVKGTSSERKRIAQIDARIAELTAERDELIKKL